MSWGKKSTLQNLYQAHLQIGIADFLRWHTARYFFKLSPSFSSTLIQCCIQLCFYLKGQRLETLVVGSYNYPV